MLMLLLTGAVIIGSALLVALLSFKFTSLRRFRLFSLAVLSAYVLCYGLGIVVSVAYPEWDDNGVMDEVRFPQHFSVALIYGGILQVVLIPGFLLVFYTVKRWVSKPR